MANVDLRKMHNNLADYFQNILKMHSDMLANLKVLLDAGDLSRTDYNLEVRMCALPPAVLTAIAQFLKTNDIMVVPDNVNEELEEYEKQLSKTRAKHGVVQMSELDISTDIN